MKRFVFITLILAFLIGCEPQRIPKEVSGGISTLLSEEDSSYQYFKKQIITVGNHSYIPMNIFNTPSERVMSILEVLQRFENLYPDVRVTGWKIEKQQNSFASTSYIFGLWIDHEPRRH